ncbi:HPP family-domain-containing protein [Xylogone sp. PMI_703]|nr:HPP family-domain-containing protein [Xylogone sp. PMI_703]
MSQKIPFDFDVDSYINPFIPASFVHLLPRPFSWLLGHHEKHRHPIPSPLVWFWSFIGAFTGMLIVEAVFHTDTLKAKGTPIIIGSMGAAAILEYNTIESPLAQPRNMLLGQFFSAIIGVGITKLFRLNPDFENLRWVAGALAVGTSSAFMGMTNTIHPPAGATALLAATSEDITELGWFLLPLVLIGSLLMLAVACLFNNIQRKFPMYWWTPVDLRQLRKGDVEEGGKAREEKKAESDDSGIRESYDEYKKSPEPKILITAHHIHIPEGMMLDYEEKAMLDVFRSKLLEG